MYFGKWVLVKKSYRLEVKNNAVIDRINKAWYHNGPGIFENSFLLSSNRIYFQILIHIKYQSAKVNIIQIFTERLAHHFILSDCQKFLMTRDLSVDDKYLTRLFRTFIQTAVKAKCDGELALATKQSYWSGNIYDTIGPVDRISWMFWCIPVEQQRFIILIDPE